MFNIRKYFSVIFVLLLLSLPFFASCYSVWFHEDFEDFNSSDWYASSTLISEENGNKFVVLNNSDSANRMMLQDSASAPGNEFFVSADFMIPEEGSDLVQVLGATYRSGKGEGCHVWYDNGDLRLGWSGLVLDDAPTLATGLQKGRWYNVFAYINHSDTSATPKYTVYFGDLKSEETEFVTKITSPASQNCGFVGRWFFASEKSGKDAYIDNIIVTPVTDYASDLAFFRERNYEINNEQVSVAITAEERNGVAVKDYLFRRGIALEQGKIYDCGQLSVTDNGKVIPSSAEVMQRYDDGSIHWLLVSAKIDLEPYETKNLILTEQIYSPSTPTKITTGDTTVAEGNKVGFTVGENGIESLLYMGEEMLSDGNINLYVTIDGEKHYLKADSIEVLKQTNSYIKLKVKGNIKDSVSGEMMITLADSASKLQIDHRITVTEELYIESIGLDIGVNTNQLTEGLVPLDYLDLGTMQLATFDTTRFNGENAQQNNAGYIIKENQVLFAPIINDNSFLFYDGMSRTAHLTISFDDDAENLAKTLQKTPKVTVDCEQYVKAGEILTTKTGALVDAAVETFKEEWEYTMGGFQAGAMSAYNFRSGNGSIAQNLPGEVEYNLGVCYMQTGDEEIFRKMYDASEFRADVAVYRGKHEECYGVMRARVWCPDIERQGLGFFQSHGYYSDEGGLYMTYLLSGDEYIYETYKLCMEKTLEDAYSREALGGTHVPEYWYWGDYLSSSTASPFKASFYEARGMIRARSLFLAADLLGDERYREAAYELVEWAKNAQLPSGAYSQAMYHNGNYLYQTGQTAMPVKDYIMLMGFRGINQILDWEDNETVLELTLKVADYLCYQGENFGAVLFQPNSDKSVYEVNEDGTRAAYYVDNIMAVDVLCTAFEQTGDDKYLTWILKFLDSYVASSIGGLGGGCREQGYPGHHGWASDNVRLTSLLRSSDNLNVIFEKQKDALIEKGYEHLYYLFCDESKLEAERLKIEDVPYPRAIYNIYNSPIGTIAYAYNQYVDITSDTESWAQKLRLRFEKSNLWQNCDNIINSASSVSVEKYLEPTEYILAVENPEYPKCLPEGTVIGTPIYIDEIQGYAKAYVDCYSEDKIVMTFQGEFEATIAIKSGLFTISDDEGYSVSVSSASGSGSYVRIIKNGSVKPQNGVLTVTLNGNGQKIATVNTAFTDDFEGYSPGALNTSDYNIRYASINETDGNQYVVLCDIDTTDSLPDRIIKDFGGQPGDRFILSMDFMIPTGGSRNAELFGIDWFAGKGVGAHLWLSERNLYIGRPETVSSNILFMENVEENRWYRVFAVVDCSESDPTCQFYIGDTVSREVPFEYKRVTAEKLIHSYDKNQSVIVSRVFSVKEADGNPIYIDNISLTTPKYFELGVICEQVEGILQNEIPGNEFGQKPEKAFGFLNNVLQDTVSKMKNNNLTKEEILNCTQQLNSALLKFEDSQNMIEYNAVEKKVTVQSFDGIEAFDIYVAGYNEAEALVDILRVDMLESKEEYQSFDISRLSSQATTIRIFLWNQMLTPHSLPVGE